MKARRSEILVNARFLGRALSGVERYAQEITHWLGGRVELVQPPKAYQGVAGHVWEQAWLPLRVGSGRLLWSPANSGPLGVRNQVVTIHDLSVIEHPEWFEPRFASWYGYLYPRLARRALKIFTDSEFSRRRLVELFHLPPEKLRVIPPGIHLARFYQRSRDEIEAARRRYELPEHYLLVVGTLEPRKNLPRLFQAWREVNRRFPEVKLLVVGSGSGNFRAPQFGPPATGVMMAGRIPDQDLPAIYSGALALAMPSLYEGFGLPVAEAMACGTPVIASNRSALPEVVGEAGLLVDPMRVDEIAAALTRFLEDGELRAQYSRKGLERARGFSIERTAERIWDGLQRL